MSQNGQKPRILVVDDDEKIRTLLTRYLENENLQVFAAGDGAAMDRIMQQEGADLVVLDLMLPGEDGLSIARRLKADSGMPIIMLSARGEDTDRIIGLEVGADDAQHVAQVVRPAVVLRLQLLRLAVGHRRLLPKIMGVGDHAEPAPGGARLGSQLQTACFPATQAFYP